MKNKYFYLKEIVNSILLSNKISKIKYYLDYLYIRKEHPEVIFQYESIFENPNKKNKNNLFLNLNNLIKKIRKYFYQLFSNYYFFYSTKSNSPNLDILIFANLINSENIEKNYDFYFGDLANILEKNNINYKIIYRNFTNINSNKLNERSNKNIIILPERVKFFSELYLIIKVFIYYIIFKINLKNYIYKKDKKIYYFFCQIGIFFTIIVNLRFELQIKYLLQIFKPKNAICTFEGHSWERILFRTIKEFNSSINCLAYQHTVFTKYQNSIFLPFPKEFNPDTILTIGDHNYNILKKNSKIDRLTKVGSPKNDLLKFHYKSKRVNKDFLRILILPESFFSETLLLFKMILQRCNYDNLNQYIFRLHPRMNTEELIKVGNINFDLPKNLIISRQTLENDINSSDIAIYRGSASAIEASIYGIYPLYFNNNQDISIDPLYSFFSDESNYFNDIKNLDIYFNYYINEWHNNTQSKKLNLITFCKKYFEQMDYLKIIKSLK